MKSKHAPTDCPICSHPMRPRSFSCRPCGLEVKGLYPKTPFAELSPDMLHFLNVFIHCEGKISDMEKALGISYPTVKSKLSQLKKTVKAPNRDEEQITGPLEILSQMEKGELAYEEGLRKIKKLQTKS